MASSPEMEPPGFEIPGPPPPPPPPAPPPPSESPSPPPSQLHSFLSTSPDDAPPPGFDTPNAWLPHQTGTGSAATSTNCQTVAVKDEILDPAMLVPPPPPPPPSPPPQTSELTIVGDGFYQPGPQTEQPKFRPFECHTAPLPTALVTPLSVPKQASDDLGLPPSPPPLPQVSESIVPESGYQSVNPTPTPTPLILLPLPPPPLALCDMPKTTPLESEHDNLNQNYCDKGPIGDEFTSEHKTLAPAQPPLTLQDLGVLDPAMLPPPPPPPPPPSSPPPQFKSELGILLVPEMSERKFDSPKMLQPIEHEIQDPPNQETETFSCPHRDETPHMLLSETDPHANQITNEPPLKKFRNMHEMHGQLAPEASRSEVEKGPLVSDTPELSPHQEEDMAALQIDMDMSEDDFDRSPTHMGPPGSDTRDSDLLEEAPPGYDTIGSNCQMEMISQDALSGMGQMVCGNCSELISYPRGAFHVLCTCCQTINLVLEACQVGNIICGQCSLLLMYPFGAPSVRCSCCRYVTEIGAHNMRPPLSIQQGEGYPNLELQLTEIS